VSTTEVVLVVAAGFLAGMVNAIAGGGSLVSFPALLAVGYPAVTANVTNSLAMWPGYASSIAAFRGDLKGQRRRVLELGATASAGGVVGVVLLLALPGSVFDAVVPWCVLFASGLLAAQPRLSVWLRSRPSREGREDHRALSLHAALFVGGIYGAYFGGGLGVVLLGLLGLYLSDHLHTVMGIKNVMSLVVSTVAALAFVFFAPIAWTAFLIVAPACFAGGFTGARLAKIIPPEVLRITIVVTGVLVGVVMLLDG
jgi:uncharacterized membrane protein YfcA